MQVFSIIKKFYHFFNIIQVLVPNNPQYFCKGLNFIQDVVVF